MLVNRKEGVPLESILTGAATFVGGALVSWVNYLLLCRLIKSSGEKGISAASPVRTLISAAYLLVLYFIGKRTGLSAVALLVGGALGLSVMLIFFTLRLTKGLKGQGKE